MKKLTDKQLLEISYLTSEVVKVNSHISNDTIKKIDLKIMYDNYILNQKVVYDVSLIEGHDNRVEILLLNPLRVYQNLSEGQKKYEIHLKNQKYFSNDQSMIKQIKLQSESKTNIKTIVQNIIVTIEQLVDEEMSYVPNIFECLAREGK